MDKRMFVEWLKAGNVSIPRLLLLHYAELGLNETELLLLIHVHSFLDEGVAFPTPAQLAKRTTFSSDECADMLHRLRKKGFLTIERFEDERGLLHESYSLDRLWEQLTFFLSERAEREKLQHVAKLEENVYLLFEQEFSRPLSPMEVELLSMWIDDDRFSPELIRAALREAVVSGKLNFRYIDRILFEWKKNGIRTVEQAKAYGEKFRQHQQQHAKAQKSRTNVQEIPSFNWLNPS